MTPNTTPKPGGTWRLIRVRPNLGPITPAVMRWGKLCGVRFYNSVYIYQRIR